MLTILLAALQAALPAPQATPPPHPAQTAAVQAAEKWGECMGRVSLGLAGSAETNDQVIDRSFAACTAEEAELRERLTSYLRAVGRDPTGADVEELIAEGRAGTRTRLDGCLTAERRREPGKPRPLC